MAINVNAVTASPTQNNTLSSNQEQQKTNVQAAQNYGQTTTTASSTHNLYHNSPNNLLSNKLLEPTLLQQIIQKAKLDRTLGDRYLSLFNPNNTSNVPQLPENMLEDMQSKLLGLRSHGHLKNLMKNFNRRVKRGESTDQSFGSHNITDEHADLSEKEKVKRKQGQTINDETINDVIKEGLRQHDTPFQRFLFLSMLTQNPSGNAEVDNKIKQELETLYQTHGTQIRANVHSLDEAQIYGQHNQTPQDYTRRVTQFNDTYYQLIQAQTSLQMFAIFKECSNLQEFSTITNLMQISAAKDEQGVTLPTSDPNTIHNVLSFMNLRTAIISLIKSADKFALACRKTKGNNTNSNLSSFLLQAH